LSRHLFGAGADVFVDANHDGRMDDLNGDGVVDQRDAAVLYALADALDRAPSEDWTVGGASAYRATDAHGPFVHVDVRGRAARWSRRLGRFGRPGPGLQQRAIGFAELRIGVRRQVVPRRHVALADFHPALLQELGPLLRVVALPGRVVRRAAAVEHVETDQP